ncbi:MAG: hypothetical protein ACE37H_11980 [Phycisphaeraceae bacterium]
MKDQSTLRGYQYVRRSVRRQRLMGLLNQPMTPAQLAQQAAMSTKTACKVVAELREHGLIRCLTPSIQRGRPYIRTKLGDSVWSQIVCKATAKQVSLKLPAKDHDAYSRVCHRHRSTVVRGLGVPRRASQIKQWIRSNLPGAKISVNNVRDVLGKLCGLGIVHRVNDRDEHYPVYALTERGQRFRDLLDQALSNPDPHSSVAPGIHDGPPRPAVVTSGGGHE